MQRYKTAETDEACSTHGDECTLVMIDGVPHLRFSQDCGLMAYFRQFNLETATRVSLDASTGDLVCGGHHISLTRMEFRLMEMLIEARGELCTYEELVSSLWMDRDVEAGRVSLRSMVSAIRIKLRAGRLPDQLLVNIRGKGLRVDPRVV